MRYPMNINLELYRIFYHVAQTLSFSKAAQELFLSQSAVSQHISNLEKNLNIQLFYRSTKKVQLTNEGHLLLQHIQPALHSILQGEKLLAETSEMNRGRLHIAASDTICKHFLLQHLHDYHENYPNIEIMITNRTSIECVKLLKNNMVDLVFTNLPNEIIDANLHVDEILTFQDIVIAPQKYKKLHSLGISYEELLDYPILLLDRNSSTTHYLQQVFKEKKLELTPSIELGSIDLLVELTRIGLGITFIPDYVLPIEPKGYFKVALRTSLPKRKLGMVSQAKAPLSNSVKTFMNLVMTQS